MKIYQSEEFGFEIRIPDEWFLYSDNKVCVPLAETRSIIFKCKANETFNIQIGLVEPEPTLEQTESNFKNYVREQGHTTLGLGRIQIAGQEHVWARYYIGGGMWSKKYIIHIQGKEYALTATCMQEKFLLEMERNWDQIVRSFHITDASSPNLTAALQALARPALLSEIPARVNLCRRALSHADRLSNPETWATLQIELAKNLTQNPQGDHAQNIEEAINHNRNALEVFTRTAYPEFWGNIHINLAAAYRKRLHGDRAENLEMALSHCRQALEVLIIHEYPLLWASAHNNLANIYRDRLQGDHAGNVEQCIAHCRKALTVFTQQVYPERWATIQNNLGNAYQDRIKGDRESNLEEAIFCYQQALEEFDITANPENWAWTHSNLGASFHIRIRGDKAQNIEQSIYHSQQALQVFTRESMPEKWAAAQTNLGNAFLTRVLGSQEENIKQAIEYYQNAASVFTQLDYPERWSNIQNLMGMATALLMEMKTPEGPIGSDVTSPAAGSLKRDRVAGKFDDREASPRLTYPNLYDEIVNHHADPMRTLRLIYADVPDIKYATSLFLVYQWDDELTVEEADRLRLRAAVYLACAIYDAAHEAGTICMSVDIRNGQRPTWTLEGNASPISVTLTETDMPSHTLQMSVGPMLVIASNLPIDKISLRTLMGGFRRKFSTIVV